MKRLFLILFISVICILQCAASIWQPGIFHYRGHKYNISKDVVDRFLESSGINIYSGDKPFVLDTMKIVWEGPASRFSRYCFVIGIDDQGVLWLKDLTLINVRIFSKDMPDSLIMHNVLDDSQVNSTHIVDLPIINCLFPEAHSDKGVRMSGFSGFWEFVTKYHGDVPAYVNVLEIKNGELIKEFEFTYRDFDVFRKQQFKALKYLKTQEYEEVKQKIKGLWLAVGQEEENIEQDMDIFIQNNITSYISQIYKPERYRYIYWELRRRLETVK